MSIGKKNSSIGYPDYTEITLIFLSDLWINLSASPTVPHESFHCGSTERRKIGISKRLSQAVKQLSICHLGGATKQRQWVGRSLLSSSTWIRRPWRTLSRTPGKLHGGVWSCSQRSRRATCGSCLGVRSGKGACICVGVWKINREKEERAHIWVTVWSVDSSSLRTDCVQFFWVKRVPGGAGQWMKTSEYNTIFSTTLMNRLLFQLTWQLNLKIQLL